MNYLLKNLGIIMIIVAVVILVIYAFNNYIQNSYLIASMLLLVFGIFAHIIFNKKVEE